MSILSKPAATLSGSVTLLTTSRPVAQTAYPHIDQVLNSLFAQLLSEGISYRPEMPLAYPHRNESAHNPLKSQSETETLKLIGAALVHDLNNALTVIVSNYELSRLSDSPEEAEEINHQLETAFNMAKSLIGELHSLFTDTPPIKERVSLTELLEEVIKCGLFSTGITYRFNPAPNLPSLQLNRVQISRVLINLVLNAVQAMPNGGQLEVTARLVRLKAGQVGDLAAGEYAEIKVQDNGIGIPAGHLNKIFAPYFTTKAEGHGLGLASSYMILKQHKGYIAVESQVGKGTAFRLWLPVN